MRPGTPRRVGAFVVGMCVVAMLVGITAVLVGAGRDWNHARTQSCDPPPIGGPGLSRIPVGGAVGSVEAGNGSIWILRRLITESSPSLVRLDPQTQRVVGRPIPLPDDALGFAVSGKDIWVTDFSGSVVRMDALTGRLVTTLAVGPTPTKLAIGFGAVWVLDANEPWVTKIDMRSNRVVARVPIDAKALAVHVGAGSVWVDVQYRGVSVVRIDPRTNAVVATLVAVLVQAIDGGSVWASGNVGAKYAVFKISPTTNGIDGPAYLTPSATVVAGGGRVWVGRWSACQHVPVPEGPMLANFEFTELDPITMTPISKPVAVSRMGATPVYTKEALWVVDPSLEIDVLRVDLGVAFGN